MLFPSTTPDNRSVSELAQALVDAIHSDSPSPWPLVIATKRYGYNSITRGDEPIVWYKFANDPTYYSMPNHTPHTGPWPTLLAMLDESPDIEVNRSLTVQRWRCKEPPPIEASKDEFGYCEPLYDRDYVAEYRVLSGGELW